MASDQEDLTISDQIEIKKYRELYAAIKTKSYLQEKGDFNDLILLIIDNYDIFITN